MAYNPAAVATYETAYDPSSLAAFCTDPRILDDPEDGMDPTFNNSNWNWLATVLRTPYASRANKVKLARRPAVSGCMNELQRATKTN